MILILCDSFQAAKEAFNLFIRWVEEYYLWDVLEIFSHCFCIETDENLRYMFIDRRMKKVFDHLHPDIVEEKDFFHDIDVMMDDGCCFLGGW